MSSVVWCSVVCYVMTRARRTQIFLTGFGPFLPDAPHNPTQALVEGLQLEGSTTATADAGDGGNICCDHFEVADCRVVAVSTEAAVAAVSALKERMSSSEDGDGDTCRVLVSISHQLKLVLVPSQTTGLKGSSSHFSFFHVLT